MVDALHREDGESSQMEIGPAEGDTVVAVCDPPPFFGHGKGEHLEGGSDEGEVSAFEANGKDPDHGSGYDTAEGREEKRQQKGSVRIVPEDQSHNVRADAEKGPVSERKEAGVSEEQVEAHREQREDKGFDGQMDPDLGQKIGDGKEEDDCDPPGEPEDLARHSFSPKKPVGFTTRTMAMSRN